MSETEPENVQFSFLERCSQSPAMSEHCLKAAEQALKHKRSCCRFLSFSVFFFFVFACRSFVLHVNCFRRRIDMVFSASHLVFVLRVLSRVLQSRVASAGDCSALSSRGKPTNSRRVFRKLAQRQRHGHELLREKSAVARRSVLFQHVGL